MGHVNTVRVNVLPSAQDDQSRIMFIHEIRDTHLLDSGSSRFGVRDVTTKTVFFAIMAFKAIITAFVFLSGNNLQFQRHPRNLFAAA